ncbi:alpha/beta fold hydrolase [Acidithiobacillus sp. AMEEHan]|uniref:alpha/beta fold hydrolase n=1 Tax=Acidithiobacillus sp. AMEEHan TaxID=2994951 RepID=UPI0027E3F566|nr:alpha/beta fold hydrolase [Acidithiobacillus sp. AMEEHan]
MSVPCESKPLILLHGWGMDRRIFAPWLPYLQPDFRPGCWDLPGHGSRPCPPEGWDWEAELAHLRECLLGLPQPPILLGWSLGGLIALALALGPQPPIAGLVLAASSPCFVQRSDWSAGIPAAQLQAFADELEGDAAAVRRRFLALQVLGDAEARRNLPRVEDWPLPDRRCLRAGLGFLQGLDLRPALRSLPFPVLILSGSDDRIVPPAAGRYLHQALSGSVLHCLPSGHAPFLAQPAACAAALREVFLP